MGLVKEIKNYLKKNLNKDRYRHTLNVRRTALELTETHLEFTSEKERKKFRRKVSLAALLHDADKGKDPDELWLKLKGDPHVRHKDIKDSKEVWHAFSSAQTAKGEFGMEDGEILNALRFHTTGRSGMTMLEKIIYLADCIEPGRSFSGVEQIREAAARGIDSGCLCAFEYSIAHLENKGASVSPYTIEAREDLLDHGIF